MSYLILLSPVVDAQLDSLRAFDHVRIIEAIENNLLHQPLTATRNRKPLDPVPPLLAKAALSILAEVDAVWELRVAPWRVAYAVGRGRKGRPRALDFSKGRSVHGRRSVVE